MLAVGTAFLALMRLQSGLKNVGLRCAVINYDRESSIVQLFILNTTIKGYAVRDRSH
jgi:hypothetical protein